MQDFEELARRASASAESEDSTVKSTELTSTVEPAVVENRPVDLEENRAVATNDVKETLREEKNDRGSADLNYISRVLSASRIVSDMTEDQKETAIGFLASENVNVEEADASDDANFIYHCMKVSDKMRTVLSEIISARDKDKLSAAIYLIDLKPQDVVINMYYLADSLTSNETETASVEGMSIAKVVEKLVFMIEDIPQEVVDGISVVSKLFNSLAE